MFGGSGEVIETPPQGDEITSDQRRTVRAYFEAKTTDWMKWVAWFGAPVVLLFWYGGMNGLPRGATSLLALSGTLVFMGTAVVEVMERQRRELVDRVIASDFIRAQELAKKRSQLEGTALRDPICCAFLRNPLSEPENYGKAFVDGNKLGRDERTRWTPHDIASVFIGREYIWIHFCAIDLTTGAALYERTRSVFYADIVSIVHQSKTITLPMPPRHSKQVKASKYWNEPKRNGVVLAESLQIPGDQKLSIALTNGEILVAEWKGTRDKGVPSDVERNNESAKRLREAFEQTKRN